MKNKKIVPIWVSVILLIICTIGTIVGAYWTVSLFKTSIIAAFLQLIMLFSNISAIVYCVSGYKKNSALFFKLVSIFLAFSSLAALAGVFAYRVTNILNILISLILLIIRFIFVFVKNLGKKNSYILEIVVLILMIVLFVNAVLGGSPTSLVIFTLSRIFVDVIFLIMIYAKYQDKEARGTK